MVTFLDHHSHLLGHMQFVLIAAPPILVSEANFLLATFSQVKNGIEIIFIRDAGLFALAIFCFWK